MCLKKNENHTKTMRTKEKNTKRFAIGKMVQNEMDAMKNEIKENAKQK